MLHRCSRERAVNKLSILVLALSCLAPSIRFVRAVYAHPAAGLQLRDRSCLPVPAMRNISERTSGPTNYSIYWEEFAGRIQDPAYCKTGNFAWDKETESTFLIGLDCYFVLEEGRGNQK